jgi:phosphomannomutase/phosphoglucomutase
MQVNPQIFRAYDLRGVADVDLNPEIVEHIGRAFGTYLKRHKLNTAVVGHDSRQSSESYRDALIKGLTWTGIDVTDIGLAMVGMFYWSQYYLKSPGGVFITASHNPPQFNGFKFANDYSETLVTDGMKELLRLVEEEDYDEGKNPGKVTKQDIREAYYDDLIGRMDIKKKMKIVVDPSGTTAGQIMPALFRKAGMEVVEKHCELVPGFYKGAADPTEAMIAERLRDEVLEAKADIGFSYDCDGDRIGIVDEKGGIIWNDVLVAIFAMDVLKDHPGDIIMYNTLCSKVVKETIEKSGGKPFMWRTGHSFLKKKNQEVKAAFIGELSGHFFFSKDFHNHDDGAYSALRLLQYLSRTNQTLSEALAKLPQYISSPEIKLFCADDKKADVIARMSPILRKDYPKTEIVDDERAGDGVRFEMPDSMFVVRYSQNGPYLTIKFEATTKERFEELRKYISKLMHSFKEVDFSSKISVNLELLK